ncbi:MAG: hypothetical protein HY243_09065 [Proteobacteria bacterium]|nr:hypothetical protein [Pseudomonadota bacterium]
MISMGRCRVLAHKTIQRCLEFDPFGFNRGYSDSNPRDLYLEVTFAPGATAQHGTISSKCIQRLYVLRRNV